MRIRNKLLYKVGYVLVLFALTNIGSLAQNYIKTTVYCDETGNENIARTSTIYYDGLGRERLSVSDKGGGNNNSIAIRTDYDRRGNIQNKWLPVPGGTELLGAKSYSAAASAFYGTNEIPYTQYAYEENGMNRPISEVGPGLLWKKHGKKISRFTNTISGKYACKQFQCGFDRISIPYGRAILPEPISLISIKGNYPAGSLRVISTTDEDGKEIIVFQDRLQRTILQRTVSRDGEYSDVYSVYDACGDLRYAISPEGSALMPESGDILASLISKYAQEFEYDTQHRCVSSRAPGCGATYYVYDKFNRVILESSATQREEGIWVMTKYDRQFRPAVKGIVSLQGKTREALQNEYGNTLLIEEPDFDYNSIESNLCYSKTSGPANFEPYIAWIYDSYDFILGPNQKESLSFVGTNDKYSQKGLCTGSLIKADGNVYIKAFKYNHKGDVVRSCFWDVFLQNFRLIDEFEYDFIGNVVKHIEKYEAIVEGAIITEQHTATTDCTYDINGRLLTSSLTIDGSSPFIVKNLKYDEIGRLSEDTSCAGIKYGYDIRSNLTDITSQVFSQQTWFGSTPASEDNVSYIFANASSLSWGKDNPYNHIETYKYDGFGHFCDMTADDEMLGETMDVNKNADVIGIVRKYRGDVVQDAVMQMDGCKISNVHDASSPYWPDAVASFSQGTYDLEYDSDGRLIKDDTRDISSITYHPFGNLPKMIKTSDGSSMVSYYFPDGTLVGRNFTKRTIEIVTKVDSKGDTIRTERVRNLTSNYQYRGNFERTPQGWIYHTLAGHYDLKAGEHYWYVRDRLGSTVAVVDANGNLLQTNGYYPSGTPYQLPLIPMASEFDAVTDKLHIGNKWIGHKGLDIYDNTARMHDPLLARFHTVDPLYSQYPGQSPWSHCVANPLNMIDKNGCEWAQMKDNKGYTVDYQWVEGEDARDKNGKLLPNVYKVAILFTAVGEDGKEFDRNSDYNIGSSIAIVYGRHASGDVHTFDACTYPSDINRYPTIPEGDYEAMVGTHSGYRALRLGDIGTENFWCNKIELGFPNPSDMSRTYAIFVNVHKALTSSKYTNFTGVGGNGKPISAACILIDTEHWDEFIGLFPNETRIGVTIER